MVILIVKDSENDDCLILENTYDTQEQAEADIDKVFEALFNLYGSGSKGFYANIRNLDGKLIGLVINE
jgi:hypothetical protein